MLKTILGAMGRGSIAFVVFLIATMPALADDQVVDLSGFSIDKITPFAPKGVNKQFNYQLCPQPRQKVHLNPGDALVVKLSKMEGRSDYGPCHLDSMISGCESKTMMSLSDGLYIAIEACEGKVIVFPAGPGLGLITASMEIPLQVTALTREQEEALLNPVLPAQGTTKICVPSDVIEAIKSEINGTVGNIYNVVIKNRSALLHAYMFALARRDGKNCLPFLASLLNADAEAKNEALNCMKMLTNADYAKSPERSTQSWEEWWQLHASEYQQSPSRK